MRDHSERAAPGAADREAAAGDVNGGASRTAVENAAALQLARITGVVAASHAPDAPAATELAARSLPDVRSALLPHLIETVLTLAPEKHTQGPPVGTPEFEALMDASTGSKSRADSHAELFLDGARSFPERARLMQQAKVEIDLETFILADDDTGRHTLQILAAAATRGVRVRLLYDAMAPGGISESSALLAALRKAGGEVRAYGTPWTSASNLLNVNHRSHVKSLIVDGQASIEGGMNIADEYAYGGSNLLAKRRPADHQRGWRDVDVKVVGRAVADAQQNFFQDWANLGSAVPKEQQAELKSRAGAVAASDSHVRMIEHRPLEKGDDYTENAYVAAIDGSAHTIDIENAYFVPTERIRKALVAAAQRGVVVRVTTNSMGSSDSTIAVSASHEQYPELLAAGVRISERQTSTLHAKTACFDGKLSLVGSVNLNGRSQGQDAETLVAITGGNTAPALTRRYEAGLADTKKVTPADLAAEDRWQKLIEWSLSAVSWTL